MSKELQVIDAGKEIINENAINSLLMLSGNLFAAKGMIPTSFKSKEEVFAALQLGYELGLKPMVSLRSVMVFNGTPALYGDAMLGLAQSTGQLEDIQEFYDKDLKAAVCIVKRSTRKSETKAIYTEEDANNNPNSGNSTWKKYRRRMMQMRARAFALRDSFPDVLRGLYDEFEVKEIEKEPDHSTSEDVSIEKAFEAVETIEHENGQIKIKEVSAYEEANTVITGLHYLGYDITHQKERILRGRKYQDLGILSYAIAEILEGMGEPEFDFVHRKAFLMGIAKGKEQKPVMEEIKAATSDQELERIEKSLGV